MKILDQRTLLDKSYMELKEELLATGLFQDHEDTTANCCRFKLNGCDIYLRVFHYENYNMIKYDFISNYGHSYSFEELLKVVDTETGKQLLFHIDLFI